jgi:hypothetical protein
MLATGVLDVGVPREVARHEPWPASNTPASCVLQHVDTDRVRVPRVAASVAGTVGVDMGSSRRVVSHRAGGRLRAPAAVGSARRAAAKRPWKPIYAISSASLGCPPGPRSLEWWNTPNGRQRHRNRQVNCRSSAWLDPALSEWDHQRRDSGHRPTSGGAVKDNGVTGSVYKAGDHGDPHPRPWSPLADVSTVVRQPVWTSLDDHE